MRYHRVGAVQCAVVHGVLLNLSTSIIVALLSLSTLERIRGEGDDVEVVPGTLERLGLDDTPGIAAGFLVEFQEIDPS